MADNDVDSIYGTQPQIDFARRIAESLLKGGNYVPDAAMATLPGSWMYGVPNIIKAISGAQYRDIAGGQQEKNLAKTLGSQPNLVNRYGARISQPNPNNNPGSPQAGAPQNTPIANNSGQDKAKVAFDYFVSQGWSPQQASGLVANIRHESDFNERALGDNNKSIGLAQWNGPRRNALSVFAGKPADQTSFQEQLAFMHHELTQGDEQAVGKMLKQVNDPVTAGGIVSSYYERPYRNESKARGITAGNMFTKYGQPNPVASAEAGPLPNVPGTTVDNAPPSLGGEQRMGLGGPPIGQGPMPGAPQAGPAPSMPPGQGAAPTGAPGPQMAQAQGIPQVPNANPQVSPGIGVGGFGVPPSNPAYHPQQLEGLLRSADPKDYPRIIDSYFKQLEGRQYESPLGTTDVRPSGAPGQPDVVTRLPPKQLQTLGIGDMNLPMMPGPNGQMQLMLPNGKGINSIDDLIQYNQRIKAEGQATNTLLEEKANQATTAQHEGMAAVPAQRSIDQMLAISKATGKGMPSGPTKDFMKQFGQFYDNFIKGDKDKAWANLPEAEAFDKLNSYLASESTKAINSRGTNFDLQTFMRANPSLSQTKEGREMMLDILRQEFESKIQIGIMASKYKAQDLPHFQEDVKKYYDSHPIVVTLPTNGKRIVMKKISKEERDQLPSGTGYIAPDNNVYYKK